METAIRKAVYKAKITKRTTPGWSAKITGSIDSRSWRKLFSLSFVVSNNFFTYVYKVIDFRKPYYHFVDNFN